MNFALMNPYIVRQIDDYFTVKYTRGDFSAIDWSTFDWEAAKDFWISLITAIAEIILPFII